MKPIISIIIPVYNAANTIRRCVESLILGKERNLQIILAEDCSVDNSWEICKELSQQYPQVCCIHNEVNRGVSYTRNHAMIFAQGEYLLFVDSDDWVSQDYTTHLISAVRQTTANELVLCGYHYINRVNGTRDKITWISSDKCVSEVVIKDVFALKEKVLIQQLWNKIFRRDIVESANIRFDETQSMGEDFQFVLDYMEAAQIKKCVVLNEPLYYYIRWNNNSLMNNFGFDQNLQESARMEQLSRLAGQESAEHRDAMLAGSKRNYVYHIVRNRKHSKQEKLEAIRGIMLDGLEAQYFREQKLLMAKERLVQVPSRTKILCSRVKGRVDRKLLERKIEKVRTSVTARDITIISQNCIGGVFYHDMGMQFLSPTINLFIKEPDFVRFALNLCHYMEQELVMRWEEEWPVGTLDDVEVHFMHYSTCKEAKECWERRKQRINWDKILILATDRNGFHDEVYDLWKQITYPKVLFTVNPRYCEESGSVVFPKYRNTSFVPDLIPKREFYEGDVLLNMVNRVGDDRNGMSVNF